MKYIFKTTILFLISAIAFMSCDKMEDVHTEFIKDGEIIYANVPDTLQTMPGRNRIQLKWLVYNGNNIQKSIVEWEDGGEMKSQSLDVSLNTPVDSVYVTVDNLNEKSYLFYAYNIDRDGNRSIKKQVTGSAYGDIYESSLTNRPLSTIEGGGTIDSVVVTWGTPGEGYAGTEVMYENTSDEFTTTMLLPEDDRIVIRDWKSEGEMDYRSFYIPAINAIDTFTSQFESTLLPNFIEFKSEKIDKADWEIADFSSEAAPSYLASFAIDDNIGTFWHSQYAGDAPDYPHHFTVDMKKMVKIDRVECFRRQGNGNGQTKFKIYTSLDGITFESWGPFDFDSQSDNGQMYYFSSLPECKFIKYEAVEGPNSFAFLSEINVYGQVIQE
jgi:hypothetical protein